MDRPNREVLREGEAGDVVSDSFEPVNVFGGVFFNQRGGTSQTIYEVPAGKLLIIEDASAEAVDAATATTPGHQGIVAIMPLTMKLRTNPYNTAPGGSADHIIVHSVSLPAGGGRTMRAYAAEGTEVHFLIGGNTVEVNTTVYFAGRLVTPPLFPQ
jgi:hypothetical protein